MIEQTNTKYNLRFFYIKKMKWNENEYETYKTNNQKKNDRSFDFSSFFHSSSSLHCIALSCYCLVPGWNVGNSVWSCCVYLQCCSLGSSWLLFVLIIGSFYLKKNNFFQVSCPDLLPAHYALFSMYHLSASHSAQFVVLCRLWFSFYQKWIQPIKSCSMARLDTNSLKFQSRVLLVVYLLLLFFVLLFYVWIWRNRANGRKIVTYHFRIISKSQHCWKNEKKSIVFLIISFVSSSLFFFVFFVFFFFFYVPSYFSWMTLKNTQHK